MRIKRPQDGKVTPDDEEGLKSRRKFLRAGALAMGALCLGCPEAFATMESAEGLITEQSEKEFPPKEAMYYKKLEALRVECQLCPRECKIADLERGYCG